MLVNNIIETIGNTPIVECHNLENKLNLEANLYVKVEFFNPGGSVKDRVAYNMIKKALESHDIDSNTTIIEPTSGNTGIGLALVCAALGLKCILVMPETMSIERRKIIKGYGAELVLTEGTLGMRGAIEKASELSNQLVNTFIPSQFENPNNPEIHVETTGEEILNDLNNNVDVFVAGIGTGGTISGVGKTLKESNEKILVIGVEPSESPMITQGIKGPHKIQGIGAGFVPINYHPEFVDQVLTITMEEAIHASKLLARTEGILVGISSGAALAIALKLAKDPLFKNKNIVALMPDTGERYLSTDLFDVE